ncbi:hypothetical protein [Paenibacillus sp. CF384]|uniref:hypothetical protein n=1 Tax=Paenibacillus sp. CF384 TaxID=1884382 RepID=UPI00089B75BA|nr:hypothetical protein [Paenibacillus sp. CF384]SDW65100.1 hypothetical protein SAMN05518855_10043 [Paenibacillus sp. CF384]
MTPTRQLAHLQLIRQSHSYIDAMHAVLVHQGFFALSKSMLAGMTSMGFRFTVHRRLAAPSTTAYNWLAEHFLAADFIGMTSSQHAGFNFDHAFPLYQKHTLRAIKESINRGAGVIFWKDAFVIAAGYDDDAQVLLVADGSEEDGELSRLPYADFGRSGHSPYWYYQLIENHIALDTLEVYRESLMQAIHYWESHDALLPANEYACGEQAYLALIELLEYGEYDTAEAMAVIRTYAAAKQDIAAYTDALGLIWPGCQPIAVCYGKVSEIFKQLSEALASKIDGVDGGGGGDDTGSGSGGSSDDALANGGGGGNVSNTGREAGDDAGAEASAGACASFYANRLVSLLREARDHEQEAITLIKQFMRETVHNRFHDIALR